MVCYSANTGENEPREVSWLPMLAFAQQQRKGFINSEGHFAFNEEIYSYVAQVKVIVNLNPAYYDSVI